MKATLPSISERCLIGLLQYIVLFHVHCPVMDLAFEAVLNCLKQSIIKSDFSTEYSFLKACKIYLEKVHLCESNRKNKDIGLVHVTRESCL